MALKDIVIRLGLTLVFSGLIGLEREKNQSNAGIKTHLLVGIGATIIALIQQHIIFDTLQYARIHPDLIGSVRSDPARLIAQVVSGIGFLGAGTIIVTNKNISGLTTAASIWTTAALGLALGMGYYELAFLGFLATMIVLYIMKRIIGESLPHKLVVKYIGGHKVEHEIIETLNSFQLEIHRVQYSVELYGNEKIYTYVYEIHGGKKITFDELQHELSKNDNIVSIQSTNI